MDVAFYGDVCPGRSSTYALDTDGSFLAYQSGSSAVSVVYLRNLEAPKLMLSTSLQQKQVTALCLGHGAIGSSDPDPHASPDSSAILCVASQDAVVCWQLAAAYAAAADEQPLPEPLLIMSRQGQVDAVAIGSMAQKLVVCAGMDVHVFELSSLRNTLRLEGHHAPVLAACFCEPHAEHLLVTAGEDRTFKVWDLKDGVMIYQSSILTASPLTSLAMDPSYPRMAAGASDGVVRFFDLSSLPTCRCLQAVDVSKQLQKIADKAAALAASRATAAEGPVVVSANSARKAIAKLLEGEPQALQSVDEDAVVVSSSASVLRLLYSPLISTSGDPEADLLGEAPKLLVGTTRGLAVLDTQTYTVVEAHYLRGGAAEELSGAIRQAEGMPKGRQQFHFLPECSLAGAYAFALEPRLQQSITCCISAAFEPAIGVFTVVPVASAGAVRGRQAGAANEARDGEEYDEEGPVPGAGSEDGQPPGVSVFLTRPLPDGCLLLQQTSASLSGLPSESPGSSSSGRGASPSQKPRSTSASKSGPAGPGMSRTKSLGAGSTLSGSKKAPQNQPVTFNRKIKSSGYGFVQPQVRMGCTPPAPVKVSKATASSAVGKHLMQQRQYPVDCGPLVKQQAKNSLPGNVPVHSSAILGVSFSSDASRVLTASADHTARAMKLPLSKYQGDGTDFIAHNAAVLSASWSHDGTMVLTASADRTARMWNAGWAQPLLEFTHVSQQVNVSTSSLPPISPSPATRAADAANKPFTSEIQAARFFYMDQFVLLASGSKLNLYRYKLCDGLEDDLERLRNNNKYKLVASYASASQTINDVSCINTFLSPLALMAGSNRSIEVVDVSTMQCVTAMEDAHARPPHALVQSVSSLYVSHPKEAYELFATASQDNSVKLWDVRSARCVRTFTGHKNGQIAARIAFSPCLRFLASGSEDKAAYLYDLRMGTVLHRIRGVHSDAVTDVAFNPLHPQLVTACLDGRLYFHSDTL